MLGELGLVDESELGTATGGRAPRLVRFAARRAANLVATQDQTAIGLGVAELSGTLLTEHHEAADLAAPPGQLTERLAAFFRWSLDRHAASQGGWGISRSVPCSVQGVAEGAFLTSKPLIMPAWEGFPLVETLTQSFGVPVWIRSSVETMTIGEFLAGAGLGKQTILFIKVGRRFGAGIVWGRWFRPTTFCSPPYAMRSTAHQIPSSPAICGSSGPRWAVLRVSSVRRGWPRKPCSPPGS